MKPIEFKDCNVIFAKHQPEYLPLPAHKSQDSVGLVTTCWELTWRERFIILFSGHLFLQQMTFNTPLQPQKPSVRRPECLI